MITVISGTARNDSNTLRVARLYHRLLEALGLPDIHLLSLQDINVWERGDELKRIEQELLIPSDRFVFIMPEYNGSFPGILKTMIDNTDIKSCWWDKKVLLTGLADGRAGNFRGLEHMTGILQYMHMHVYWDKLPISRIKEEIDTEGKPLKEITMRQIDAQIEGFLRF
jgi:NAD(P)H-dependent FMN reductase